MTALLYGLVFLTSASRELKKIDAKPRRLLGEAILGLRHDPRPAGSKKLVGRDAYRLRAGMAIGTMIRPIHRVVVDAVRAAPDKEVSQIGANRSRGESSRGRRDAS